ncbi:MAG: hypothetical protein KUG77_23550 [Nannocystaceae bacterium]|nr:hypothetical protein [Nannocystaceae bacterium]
MRMHGFPLLSAAVSLTLGGCYAAELDETVDALFACEVSGLADEADVDCPGSLRCNGRVCVERLPTVSVLSPESLQVLPLDEEVVVALQVSGLTFSSDEDDAGGGFIRVTLDDESIDILAGDLTGTLVVENLTVPTGAGAHRIRAQAMRVDGTPFDNDGASSAQVFWRNDGNPHVAITSPWPGSEFELQPDGLIDVEVAMLNFSYGQPDTALAEGTGHVHVYYDDEFPECAQDIICDAGYIGVVSAAPEQAALRLTTLSEGILLPESPAAETTLTAVLRQNDHSPFTNVQGELELVIDTVPISRIAD